MGWKRGTFSKCQVRIASAERESSNGVIYTSARVLLFHREKQMPAKRGGGKSLQESGGVGGCGGGGDLPKQSAAICCESDFKYWETFLSPKTCK